MKSWGGAERASRSCVALHNDVPRTCSVTESSRHRQRRLSGLAGGVCQNLSSRALQLCALPRPSESGRERKEFPDSSTCFPRNVFLLVVVSRFVFQHFLSAETSPPHYAWVRSGTPKPSDESSLISKKRGSAPVAHVRRREV